MALTAALKQQFQNPDVIALPLAASTKIYQGDMVMWNGSGYVIPGADTASCRFAGIALETVDNSSGSAGDLYVKLNTREIYRANAASAAAATWQGIKVYLNGDGAVALAATTTNDILAGICVKVIDATHVLVMPVTA